MRNVPSRSQFSKCLPYLLREEKDDILHMSYYGYYPFSRGEKVVTVHDFIHEMFGCILHKIVMQFLVFLKRQRATVCPVLFKARLGPPDIFQVQLSR